MSCVLVLQIIQSSLVNTYVNENGHYLSNGRGDGDSGLCSCVCGIEPHQVRLSCLFGDSKTDWVFGVGCSSDARQRCSRVQHIHITTAVYWEEHTHAPFRFLLKLTFCSGGGWCISDANRGLLQVFPLQAGWWSVDLFFFFFDRLTLVLKAIWARFLRTCRAQLCCFQRQ